MAGQLPMRNETLVKIINSLDGYESQPKWFLFELWHEWNWKIKSFHHAIIFFACAYVLIFFSCCQAMLLWICALKLGFQSL
jgi:hypothetical protein